MSQDERGMEVPVRQHGHERRIDVSMRLAERLESRQRRELSSKVTGDCVGQ